MLPKLLFLFTLVSLGMALISGLQYRDHRSRMNELQLIFWITQIINLFFNAIVSTSDSTTVVAMSILPWPIIVFVIWEILKEIEPELRDKKLHDTYLYLGYLFAGVLAVLGKPMTVILIPGILGLNIFGFKLCYLYFKQIKSKKGSPLEYFLLLMIFSFFMHSLFYPWVRPHEDVVVYGFTYYLFNTIGFAVVLPAISVKKHEQHKRAELESIVKERTRLLLETAHLSALGEMAAGLAHEINNPLAIISGKAQVMLKRNQSIQPDQKAVNDFNLILDSCNRINHITRSLLEFSQRGGSSSTEIKPFVEILDASITLLHQKIIDLGAQLESNGNFNIQITSQRGGISQVIYNLLINSCEALEKSEERWIRVTAVTDAKFICISITDSGPGISRDIIFRIFHPFFTTKEFGKGLGLGLPVAKGIVEKHGGVLYLDESSPRTKFVVKLPLA
jgi:signal transduction histidine kinase